MEEQKKEKPKRIGVWQSWKEKDIGVIKFWKQTMIWFVGIDVFVIYWLFDLKKVGLAALIVGLIIFALLFYLEHQKKEEKDYSITDEPPEDKQKKIDNLGKEIELKKLKNELIKLGGETNKEEKEPGLLGGFDLGLGSAEEYRERLEKSMKPT